MKQRRIERQINEVKGMKAKELAKLLLKHPDLEVEICIPEIVWAYGEEHTRYLTHDEFEVDVVHKATSAVVEIECL